MLLMLMILPEPFRFEGHVAKYLGDGVLAYFGYPQAHEDDPRRAAAAGLAIVRELAELNARLQETRGLRLSARVGIHTGLVVAGEMGAGDTREPLAIVGETPNIAARVQDVAAADTVVVSAATHRLIQGWFDCQEIGLRELKGISQPVQVYRVLTESGVEDRLDVAGQGGLTPPGRPGGGGAVPD